MTNLASSSIPESQISRFESTPPPSSLPFIFNFPHSRFPLSLMNDSDIIDLPDFPATFSGNEEVYDHRYLNAANKLVAKFGCRVVCECSISSAESSSRTILSRSQEFSKGYGLCKFRCTLCWRSVGVREVIERYRKDRDVLTMPPYKQQESSANPSPTSSSVNSAKNLISTPTNSDCADSADRADTDAPSAPMACTSTPSYIIKTLRDNLDKLDASYESASDAKDTKIGRLEEELKDAKAQNESLNARVKKLEEENQSLRMVDKKFVECVKEWMDARGGVEDREK